MLKRIEIIPIYIKGQITPNSNIVNTLSRTIKKIIITRVSRMEI